MSKAEETKIFIEYVTKIKSEGIAVDDTIFLADIAMSLAIIADKLRGAEMKEVDEL